MENLSLFDRIVMQDELLICDLCGAEDMAKYSIINGKYALCIECNTEFWLGGNEND